MDFFGIGPGELLLILIVALIVVGPGKLPGIARTMGKTVRAIRRASTELTSVVTKEMELAEKAEKSAATIKAEQPSKEIPAGPGKAQP